MPDALATPSRPLCAALAAFCVSAIAGVIGLSYSGVFVAVAIVAVGVSQKRFRALAAACAVGAILGMCRASLPSASAAASDPSTSGIAALAGRVMPSPEAELAAALLLGGKQGIPTRLVADFRNAGIAHLLAASGYNVALLVSIAVTALCVVGLKRRVASACTIAAVGAFVLAAGGQSSVVRAACMGSLALVARVLGRRYHPGTALLLAASAMLLLDPGAALHDAGFQLSFSAVWGLQALAPALKERFTSIPDRLGLRSIAAETAAATLATLPATVLTFGALPALAIVANVLALPAVPVATGLALVATLAAAVWPPAAFPFAWTATLLLRYVEAVAALFGRTIDSVIAVPAGPIAATLIAVSVLLLWYALRRAPATPIARPSSGVIIES
jgi:competence protein ComEC